MKQSTPKKSFALLLTSLVAGTQKNLPNGTFTLNGQSYTSSSLTSLLESVSAALAKTSAAEATWHDTLQQERTLRSQVAPVLAAYTNLLHATYGSSPAILAEYGLTPRKARAPLTAKKQAAAAAKSAATRQARHTMGSQQKKDVKGNVTGVVVTPITEPAPSPTPAAPATSHGVAPATNAVASSKQDATTA